MPIACSAVFATQDSLTLCHLDLKTNKSPRLPYSDLARAPHRSLKGFLASMRLRTLEVVFITARHKEDWHPHLNTHCRTNPRSMEHQMHSRQLHCRHQSPLWIEGRPSSCCNFSRLRQSNRHTKSQSNRIYQVQWHS